VVIITIIAIHIQKEKKKEFSNIKYVAMCLKVVVDRECISVSSSTLHPSVTCVNKDTSNLTQSNIQYVVIEIVTVIKCNWFGLM